MRDLIKYKKMDEIVVAIRGHGTLKDAANSLNCDVRTLQRYMEDEEFRERFFEFSSLTRRAAAVSIAAHQLKAAKTLASLLDSPSDSVRIQAVNALLKLHGPMVADVQVLDQIQIIKSQLRKAEAKEEI